MAGCGMSCGTVVVIPFSLDIRRAGDGSDAAPHAFLLDFWRGVVYGRMVGLGELAYIIIEYRQGYLLLPKENPHDGGGFSCWIGKCIQVVTVGYHLPRRRNSHYSINLSNNLSGEMIGREDLLFKNFSSRLTMYATLARSAHAITSASSKSSI